MAVSKHEIQAGLKLHRRLGHYRNREKMPLICRHVFDRAQTKRVAVAVDRDGVIYMALDGIDWLVEHAAPNVAGIFHRPKTWLDINDAIRATARNLGVAQ